MGPVSRDRVAAWTSFARIRREPPLTAHFLKSVCFEIGQVASRVSLFHQLRFVEEGHEDQADRRLVAALGLEAGGHLAAAGLDLTTMPRCRPRFLASSGCMKTWASAPPCAARARGGSSSRCASAPARGRCTATCRTRHRASRGVLVGQREDDRLAVLVAVELHALALLDVGS